MLSDSRFLKQVRAPLRTLVVLCLVKLCAVVQCLVWANTEQLVQRAISVRIH